MRRSTSSLPQDNILTDPRPGCWKRTFLTRRRIAVKMPLSNSGEINVRFFRNCEVRAIIFKIFTAFSWRRGCSGCHYHAQIEGVEALPKSSYY
jgi:hypothetical protein